jgi:hypothetical protein
MKIGEGMSQHSTEYFHEQQRQFTKWVESPHKFINEDSKVTINKLLDASKPTFKAGSNIEGVFKDSPHIAWHEYRRKMETPAYQKIMNN